ncbi:MAG: PEP-CTERM sorting domain-containing protein [Sulfuriferula sp.]
MHKWIQVLMIVLALTTTYPSAASIITGADGPFAPVTDYTLPYRADGIFDFTSIDIGANITLRFDARMPNITLLSLRDILIAGLIDATGINLILETPGQLILTGGITADGIDLIGGRGLSNGATSGNECLSILPHDCGSLILPSMPILSANPVDLQPGAGSISLSVPEPGTLWLMMLILPLLMRLKRK